MSVREGVPSAGAMRPAGRGGSPLRQPASARVSAAWGERYVHYWLLLPAIAVMCADPRLPTAVFAVGQLVRLAHGGHTTTRSSGCENYAEAFTSTFFAVRVPPEHRLHPRLPRADQRHAGHGARAVAQSALPGPGHDPHAAAAADGDRAGPGGVQLPLDLQRSIRAGESAHRPARARHAAGVAGRRQSGRRGDRA